MARVLGTAEKGRKLISYRYEAATGQGRLVKGTIKATDEIAAERLLIKQGYRPVSVEVVPSMFSLEEALPSLFQIKPRDVVVFSRQMATLLRSGISLLPALEILQGQVIAAGAFHKLLGTLISELRAGGSFSQVIAKHPKAFSDIYCRTIAVGEQTGNLETVLNQMADYLEKQATIAKKIGGALAYPMIVLGVGVVVIVILMVVVMPQLTGMFAAMSVELPLPTRILLGASDILITYPLYFLVGGAVLAIIVLWLVKQPTGRQLLDRVLLTVPVIGPPTLLGELARFSRSMSVMVGAGLSLQEIMEAMPQSSNNRFIRSNLAELNERLLLGEGLSEPMSHMPIFPPLMVQMVAVGEETNTLDFTMGVVADFYEISAADKMSTMVGMIGPISTIGISLLVGFIAMSVIMPMYSLIGAFD